MENIHIRCPKCSWKPDGGAHWQCTCGTIWDTFSTGARCPGCGRVWEYTQCVDRLMGGCSQTSPHLNWYEGLDDAINQLKQALKESWSIVTSD
ncbi:MAG: hypothetical protein QM763_06585 [Agriterribacter sp.]